MTDDILRRLVAPPTTAFRLEDYLFPEQLAFVTDLSTNSIAVCSRRAGKSTAVAASLVITAFSFSECTALYVTESRTNAKKIIWRELLKFNRVHKLGGIPNISELTLSFPNGSVVRLHGAMDEGEIDKIRGQLPPLKKVYIDEAQKIRDSLLTILIDDVLEPALLDYGASISLLGTPGNIPTGYFYRMAHNLKDDGSPLETAVWSVHSWTFFDNPFIAKKSGLSHEELLNRVLKRRGLSKLHPSIQREYYGMWTLDVESLLYQYNEKINHYDVLPKIKGAWSYVIGVDLGYRDADAVCVLAWNDESKVTYLVHEVVTHGQAISELVSQIEKIQVTYPAAKIVVDQGGLGKKIAEELRRRYHIPVEAAEKARKMEHVKIVNDALRTGQFRAKRDSRFAQDSYLVEIDRDKTTPDKIVVSDTFHSDICDAVLYAYIKSYSFTFSKPKEKTKIATAEWYKEQEDSMFQKEIEGLKREQEELDPWSKMMKGEL